jgi:TolB-like protein
LLRLTADMGLESNVTQMNSGRRAKPRSEEVPTSAVREQLARILRAPAFQRSERLSRFLEYIVDRSLRGGELIREVDLALDVFGKRGSFDSRTDPIVRVEARRLRKAIAAYYASDGYADPVFIAIPPRGYTPQFQHRQPGDQRPPGVLKEPHGTIQTNASGPSIVVLPFINMTNEPERDVFCQGVTEELINALTHVEDFKVVSRTSAYQFKDKAIDLRKVGKDLGVQTIVEGSVRADGERLRVTAQLSSAADGFHLWSQTFDATLTDTFEVQERLAHEMSEQIAEQLIA